MSRVAAIALGLGLASTARAAPGADGEVALPAGVVEAQLVVEGSLAFGQVLAPTAVAPDAWLGVTDRWTLGVTHSDPSRDLVDVTASLCVRDPDRVCSHAYRGGALDARYLAWTDAGLAVAPRARLVVRDVDPWKPAITVGALLGARRGRWSVTGDPYLQLGLWNTDRGNRAQLVVPVTGAVRLGGRAALTLETGYVSEVVNWQDGYHVPLALGGRVRVAGAVELGLAAGFTSLAGPQNNVKQRVAWLALGWRGAP